MNIHIDKNEFDYIIENATFDKYIIGSHLYGLNNNESDNDYLYIIKNYIPSYNNNPVYVNHQLQYKDVDNNTDHVFTDTTTFWKNIISGDSNINYEVLTKYGLLNSTDISIVDLHSYTLVNAYLGLAKRDCKNVINNKLSNRDMQSALIHAHRGFEFGKSIHRDKVIKDLDCSKLSYIYDIKSELKLQKMAVNLLNDILIKIENLRRDLVDRDIDSKLSSNCLYSILELITNSINGVFNLPKSVVDKQIQAYVLGVVKYK